MAQKRKEEIEFKVSDRRLFTSEGELRDSADEQAPSPVATVAVAAEKPPAATSAPTSASTPVATIAEAPPHAPSAEAESDVPEPPSALEQQASRDLDKQVELSGHSAKELEMSFERFMASLYMTAMMHLGLMHEKGGHPGVDIIGARQTIDTLGMIAEKTKGNLTPKEQGFLQNCLYELRMAYVEVTNAIAHPPQAPGPHTGTNG